MKNAVLVFQILISIGLVISILLQSKGSGLGSAYGGDSGSSYRSKRGVEKLLVRASVVLAALFLITSIVNILLH